MAVTFQTGFNDGFTLSEFTSITGTPTAEAVIFDTGSGPYSMRADASSTATFVNKSVSGTMLVGQLRFYVPSSVSAGYNFRLVQAFGSVATLYFRVNMNGGTPFAYTVSNDGTDKGTQATGTITLDAWHRITFRANVAANPWVIDWQFDGVAQTQSTPAISADSFIGFDLGNMDAAAGLLAYFDDWVIANNTADYPLADTHIPGVTPEAGPKLIVVQANRQTW